MSSFLTNLENNEAVLLMYLANELPAEDRAEVQEMLKIDEQLRRQYETLRDAYASLDSAFGRAEASLRVGSSFSAARSFGDAVRSRQKIAASVDDHHDAPRRLRWVMYPIAGAAAVAVGMLIWWQTASKHDNGMPGQNMPFVIDWQRDPADEAYLNIWNNAPPPQASLTEVTQELEIVSYLRTNALW